MLEALKKEPEGRINFELHAQWGHLKALTANVEEVPRVRRPPTKKYHHPSAVAALSIGNGCKFLPEMLDAVLVRLHFSQKIRHDAASLQPSELVTTALDDDYGTLDPDGGAGSGRLEPRMGRIS